MTNALSSAHAFAPSGIAKGTQRKRVMFWHDAIIDQILLYPNKTLKEIAKDLGRAESTIYLVTSSDVFRHRLAARRAEHSQNLSENLVTNTARVANKALDMVMERLEDGSAAKISALQLFSMADKALERLGYGAPKAGVVINNTQNAFVSAPADAIAAAQAMLREREAIAVRNATLPGAGPEPDMARPLAKGSGQREFPSEVPSDIIDLEAIKE